MRAVEREYNSILALFGKAPTPPIEEVIHTPIPTLEPIKKKIRINIDTDVEYIENIKALV